MPKVKRLSKIIHPKSRMALEIASKQIHNGRVARSQQDTKNKFNLLSRKLTWFKEAITAPLADDDGDDEMEQQSVEAEQKNQQQQIVDSNSSYALLKDKPVYTIEELKSLIEQYFHRFDSEIEQINLKNSIGKRSLGQHFSREKAIEMTLSAEKHEYETVGIAVPDLTNAKNVEYLRKWIGDTNSLQAIKLKTIKKL